MRLPIEGYRCLFMNLTLRTTSSEKDNFDVIILRSCDHCVDLVMTLAEPHPVKNNFDVIILRSCDHCMDHVIIVQVT